MDTNVQNQLGAIRRNRGIGATDLARRTGLRVLIENAPIACALSQMWLGQRGEGEALAP